MHRGNILTYHRMSRHDNFQEIPPSQKTFRIPESSTTTPTIRIVLNSLNSNSESPQMSREIMPPVTTPNPLQFSRAQIPPPQSPSSQHSSAQSMNHYQVYEPTQSVFHQQVPPTDKNQFSFDISQKRTIGWPPNASPTSFHHTPPSTLPPVPAPQLSKSNTIKVARRSFPSTFPSISTNPSAVAPSSSLNHENQMYSFPHGNSDPVQPSAIHSQDPIQVQTPMMPMNHHINYHSPQSTSVQSYHHIYDKPSSHYTEAMFFMEKPRKKTSSFVTTELPTLSHTQAHKSQQHINFSCSTRRSGYYANRMYKCQVNCFVSYQKFNRYACWLMLFISQKYCCQRLFVHLVFLRWVVVSISSISHIYDVYCNVFCICTPNVQEENRLTV